MIDRRTLITAALAVIITPISTRTALAEAAMSRITAYAFWFFQALDRQVWPINVDSSFKRVEQQPELRALFNIFLHLGLQYAESIAGRSQLQHKIGTKRRKFFLLLIG